MEVSDVVLGVDDALDVDDVGCGTGNLRIRLRFDQFFHDEAVFVRQMARTVCELRVAADRMKETCVHPRSESNTRNWYYLTELALSETDAEARIDLLDHLDRHVLGELRPRSTAHELLGDSRELLKGCALRVVTE